jgi:uncharacterized protein
VPLQGDETSSTARDAYGSIAVALPADPETLCLMLLREEQRVKLGGVLDMFNVFRPSSTVSLDTERLLFDSYARLAVTDFWQRRSGPKAAPAAIADADLLLASGSLTRLGREFVEEMRRTVDSWSP